MSSHVRRLRFEEVSLGAMGAAIAVLYAAALGDPAVGRFAIESAKPTPTLAVAPMVSPGASPGVSPVVLPEGALEMAPVTSVASLASLFQRVDYRLEGVRLGEMTVPRVLVDKVPVDLAAIESVSERKRLFIQLALPIILYVNEKIMADRERLIELREDVARNGRIGAADDRRWFDDLSRRYGLETPDIDALLRRVDMIPPSLALAQGAEESGWGTSRFVREGNAIFGQRTFVEGAGLVPERRDSDKSHEVKTFGGLVESVASYMTNLNTHFAYDKFREMRQSQRAALGYLDVYTLVEALGRYSERGDAYILTIRSIIETNGLRAYDRARLSDGDVLAGVEPNI